MAHPHRPSITRPEFGRRNLQVQEARRRPLAATLAAVCLFVFAGIGIGGYVLAQNETRRAATEAALKDDAVLERTEADAQRERAQQLKAVAEEHFRKACAAVDTLLARVGHERLAYEPRMEQIRQELLQKATSFYEGFLRERGDDPGALGGLSVERMTPVRAG